MYLQLKRKLGRWPTEIEDWIGYNKTMPGGYRFYIWTHSLIPALAVGTIETIVYGFPYLAIGWAVHVVYDVPSHSGEFKIRPFHPISKWSSGYVDAWAWPKWKMALSWGIHAIVIVLLYIVTVVR